MKKQIVVLAILLFSTVALFSQVSQGDIQIVQKYFGVEKAALLKEYMQFTPWSGFSVLACIQQI
jgi:hypothetical protein